MATKNLFDILSGYTSGERGVSLPFCKSLAMVGTSRCFMPTYIAIRRLQRMILV